MNNRISKSIRAAFIAGASFCAFSLGVKAQDFLEISRGSKYLIEVDQQSIRQEGDFIYYGTWRIHDSEGYMVTTTGRLDCANMSLEKLTQFSVLPGIGTSFTDYSAVRNQKPTSGLIKPHEALNFPSNRSFEGQLLARVCEENSYYQNLVIKQGEIAHSLMSCEEHSKKNLPACSTQTNNIRRLGLVVLRTQQQEHICKIPAETARRFMASVFREMLKCGTDKSEECLNAADLGSDLSFVVTSGVEKCSVVANRIASVERAEKRDSSGRAFVECARAATLALDDRTSPVDLVASAVAARCESLLDDESKNYSQAFLASALPRISGLILESRAAAQSKSQSTPRKSKVKPQPN